MTKLFDGDWETGDRTQWPGEQIVAADRYQILTDPPGLQTYVARVEVRSGDDPIGAGTERAEVLHRGSTLTEIDGTRHFITFSFWIPADWRAVATTTGWCIICQLHAGAGGTQPIQNYQIRGTDDFRFVIRGGTGTVSVAGTILGLFAEKEIWNHFIVENLYQKNTTGEFRIWHRRDNQTSFTLLKEQTGISTLYNTETASSAYWKMGLYRPNTSFTSVLYNDNFNVYTTFAEAEAYLLGTPGQTLSGNAILDSTPSLNTAGQLPILGNNILNSTPSLPNGVISGPGQALGGNTMLDSTPTLESVGQVGLSGGGGSPIVFSNLGVSANPDINDSAISSSYVNTSWTPPTSGLIIAYVAHGSNATGVTVNSPTISGNNLTWSTIATILVPFGAEPTRRRISLLGANLAGSSVGATSIAFAGQTQFSCMASFFQAENVDLGSGVSSAFIQAVSATGEATSGSIGLAAPGHSSNRPIFGLYHRFNEVSTPRTNWTEVDDVSGSNRNLETQYRSDLFEQTASAIWATSAVWGGIAAELKFLTGEVQQIINGNTLLDSTPSLETAGMMPIIGGDVTNVVGAPNLKTGGNIAQTTITGSTLLDSTPSLESAGSIPQQLITGNTLLDSTPSLETAGQFPLLGNVRINSIPSIDNGFILITPEPLLAKRRLGTVFIGAE